MMSKSVGTTVQGDDDKSEGDTGEGNNRGAEAMVAGRLTMTHFKKKEVAKSSVIGVQIEFDHLRLASILGIPGNNGISVVDEAADQGESGSGEKFYDAEDEIQESTTVVEEIPAVASAQQKETEVAGVDPSGSSGHIPDSVMSKLQADFERARANRIQADLERAQAKNARLLVLLQQAKSQPKP
ncbi:hypothetical protein Dimus_034096 [Dionaea muscipula]